MTPFVSARRLVRFVSSAAATGVALAALVMEPAAGAAAASPEPGGTWAACGDGFECTSVTVPWDHANPAAGTLAIPVVRHPATGPGERLGAIVYNPGGPGIPGTGMLMALIGAFPAVLQERFDIVSFDPRGTGAAERVDCGTDVAALFALDQAAGPEGPAAAAWRDMAAACQAALGAHLADVSTAATAEDIDLIRAALGEDSVSWFGTSYGTRLGAEYLRRHPDRVRAMVLDGSMDPGAPLDQQARDMAAAAEPVVGRLLDVCGGVDPCPLGDEPVAAYDALAASLATRPLTSSDGHEVGPATLAAAAQSAAALPFFNAQPFIQALAAARDGQADGLLSLGPGGYVDLAGQGTFDAQWAILCNDEASHPDAAASAALTGELIDAAPRAGLSAAIGWGVGCQAWPDAVDPLPPFAFAAAPPVLVVGSTGDPSTSYAWAGRMAEAIDGARLLTREGDGHTAFFNTFLQGCSGKAIADFLVDPAGAALPATCAD